MTPDDQIITPATDEFVAKTEQFVHAFKARYGAAPSEHDDMLALVARIRVEQEWSRKRAEDIVTLGQEVGRLTEHANSIREATIRQCAALCQSWIDAPTFNHPILMYRPTVAGDIQHEILRLVEPERER